VRSELFSVARLEDDVDWCFAIDIGCNFVVSDSVDLKYYIKNLGKPELKSVQWK